MWTSRHYKKKNNKIFHWEQQTIVVPDEVFGCSIEDIDIIDVKCLKNMLNMFTQ